MRSIRTVYLITTLGVAAVFLYYHYYYVASLPASIVSSTPTMSSTLSPLEYKIVVMNDRQPFFKLATIDGRKPYADGDRAQEAVVNSLQLADQCKRDPSLVVVDIGAFLGEFGLYAAACGCRVFLFEVQPNMINLIRTSIALNNFSPSRVQIVPKAVSNLPSNTRLTFSVMGGQTTVSNGSLKISTIRLDDVQWPDQSNILLLKIDVEGFELNVIRSAERLFREKRVRHLIFEYTAWWTDRAAQNELLPLVEKKLGAKTLYALDRTSTAVYGPLTRQDLDQFHEKHIQRHLQTDIYAVFNEPNESSSLKVQPYNPAVSFA